MISTGVEYRMKRKPLLWMDSRAIVNTQCAVRRDIFFFWVPNIVTCDEENLELLDKTLGYSKLYCELSVEILARTRGII